MTEKMSELSRVYLIVLTLFAIAITGIFVVMQKVHIRTINLQKVTISTQAESIVSLQKRVDEKPKVVYVKRYIVATSTPTEIVDDGTNPLADTIAQLSQDLAISQAALKKANDDIAILSKKPQARNKAVMVGIDTDGLILGHSWRVFQYINLGAQIDMKAHPGAFANFSY